MGTEGDKVVRARLESRSGKIPVLFTCSAATEALRRLGAHRVALVHPPWFAEELKALKTAFLAVSKIRRWNEVAHSREIVHRSRSSRSLRMDES